MFEESCARDAPEVIQNFSTIYRTVLSPSDNTDGDRGGGGSPIPAMLRRVLEVYMKPSIQSTDIPRLAWRKNVIPYAEFDAFLA